MPSPRSSLSPSVPSDVLADARERLNVPSDLTALTAKLGARDQVVQARRLALIDAADPRRGRLWRRLASLLFSLAPGRPRILQRATLFYIPDGKYQMQVFALNDSADGTQQICCEDIAPAALAAGLLARQSGQPSRYQLLGTPHALEIDSFDGSMECPAYCNAMTGWKRKALRITLPSHPSAEQTDTVELLCALSSTRWMQAAQKDG